MHSGVLSSCLYSSDHSPAGVREVREDGLGKWRSTQPCRYLCGCGTEGYSLVMGVSKSSLMVGYPEVFVPTKVML